MARSSTIYKAELELADMDREYYATLSLTIACHPSETVERMMVRLLAYALFAGEGLEFGGGVSTQGEPDLWQKDLTGAIQLWLELGHPEERALRRASGRAARVVVLCYGGRGSQLWWSQNENQLANIPGLSVLEVPEDMVRELATFAGRNMRLQMNIQDETITIFDDQERMLNIELVQHLGQRRPSS